MRLTRLINDVLEPFDLRLTRVSGWREQNKLSQLARSSLANERIQRLGCFMVPLEAKGQSKVRLGSKYDGGYVCLYDFENVKAVLSLGIGGNDDWDISIAERGIPVYQFDHSIDKPPHWHPNCRFQRKRIVPIEDGTNTHETIANITEKICAG